MCYVNGIFILMPIPDRIRAELFQLRDEIVSEHPIASELFDNLEFDNTEDVAMLLFAAAAMRDSVSLYFNREDGQVETITAHARKDPSGEPITVIAIDSPNNAHSPDVLDFAVELGMQMHRNEVNQLIAE